MSRISTVTRMQFVNKWTFIYIPLIILAGSFALSLMIVAIIPYDGAKYGGGAQAPLWYFMGAGVLAMTATFPFSQAMSITRREFFFGTFGAATITALILAVLFVVGGLIEEATHGFGMNGYFFRLDWLWTAGPLVAGLFYFSLTMLLFAAGFFFSAIFRRWGALGLTIALVGLGAALVAALFIIGRLDAWVQVGEFFSWLGVTGLTVGVLVLAIIAAGAAYLPLRRSTP